MKMQVRFYGAHKSTGHGHQSDWLDVDIKATIPMPEDLREVWGIEHQEVPVDCQSLAPFKLDKRNIQCERVQHGSNTPHKYIINSAYTGYFLEWE